MNAQLLKRIKLPIHQGINKQDKIVTRLIEVQEEIDEMKREQLETKELLLDMEQAILAQAFRGQL